MAGTTVRADVDASGTVLSAAGQLLGPTVSGDGRRAAFWANATFPGQIVLWDAVPSGRARVLEVRGQTPLLSRDGLVLAYQDIPTAASTAHVGSSRSRRRSRTRSRRWSPARRPTRPGTRRTSCSGARRAMPAPGSPTAAARASHWRRRRHRAMRPRRPHRVRVRSATSPATARRPARSARSATRPARPGGVVRRRAGRRGPCWKPTPSAPCWCPTAARGWPPAPALCCARPWRAPLNGRRREHALPGHLRPGRQLHDWSGRSGRSRSTASPPRPERDSDGDGIDDAADPCPLTAAPCAPDDEAGTGERRAVRVGPRRRRARRSPPARRRAGRPRSTRSRPRRPSAPGRRPGEAILRARPRDLHGLAHGCGRQLPGHRRRSPARRGPAATSGRFSRRSATSAATSTRSQALPRQEVQDDRGRRGRRRPERRRGRHRRARARGRTPAAAPGADRG